MSASLSPRPDVAILPSLPPSPSFLEEVFSHPRPWSISRNLQDSRRSSSASPGSHTKGKGKKISEDEDEGDEEDEEDEDMQHRLSAHEAYPPINDEAAETRRVEETLKRWELAERQRRKSARGSVQHSSSPSLLSSVTRTAGLVFSGRSTVLGASTVGPGAARSFKSHESVDVAREGYAVPLDDIDRARSSWDVVVHSPSPSSLDRSTSSDAGTGAVSGSATSENPFMHPSERTRTLAPVTATPMLPPSTPLSPSPFADAYTQPNPTTRLSAEKKTHTRNRSSRSGAPSVPPRRPLDLPPPPDGTPHVTPLQPTPQPVPRPPRHVESEERDEVRWWHDWLCGCSEGPDRGGDHQAGRTNPFE